MDHSDHRSQARRENRSRPADTPDAGRGKPNYCAGCWGRDFPKHVVPPGDWVEIPCEEHPTPDAGGGMAQHDPMCTVTVVHSVPDQCQFNAIPKVSEQSTGGKETSLTTQPGAVERAFEEWLSGLSSIDPYPSTVDTFRAGHAAGAAAERERIKKIVKDALACCRQVGYCRMPVDIDAEIDE